MKKKILINLSVLGMVLGTIAVVQPAKAHCEMVVTDPYGCDVWDCPDMGCIYWHCVDTPGNGEFCG